MRAIVALIVSLLAAGCQPDQIGQTGQPSQPASSGATAPAPLFWAPATDAVVDAFEDHSVVAIGEIHGSRAIHTFLQALLGEPRLVGVLNDVAVEFGSARHQATIDRYVLGEEVMEDELELVWTDTTQQSGVWNSPIVGSGWWGDRHAWALRRAHDSVANAPLMSTRQGLRRPVNDFRAWARPTGPRARDK
jgi:hypothetical protein